MNLAGLFGPRSRSVNTHPALKESAIVDPTQKRSTGSPETMDMNKWFAEKVNFFSGGSRYRSASDGNSWQIPTVYAIISIIAEDIASLGHDLYTKTGQGNSVIDFENKRAKLLGKPNDSMTAFTLKEVLMLNLLSKGNGYSRIYHDSKGVPSELEYIENPTVYIDHAYYKKRKKLFYHVEGVKDPLFPWEMLHYKRITSNGIEALSPFALLNKTMHETLRSQDISLEFLDNGATPKNALIHPGKLGEEGYNILRKSFNSEYTGPNGEQTIILDEGMRFEPIQLTPEDAQTLKQRKFNIAELCRPFRMPLHMVQEMEGATFSNIEHQTLAYSKFCLRPYVKRLEAEENFKLLSNRDFGKRYFKYNIDSLLRADVKTRSLHLKNMFQNGLMTQNEIRNLENLPSMPGGDVLMTPVNMRDKLTEPLGGKIKTKSGDEEE